MTRRGERDPRATRDGDPLHRYTWSQPPIPRTYYRPDEAHEIALERATSRQPHLGAPGTAELPADRYRYWQSWMDRQPGVCYGQLRRAYVRLSVGGRRSTFQTGYAPNRAGKPTWTPIGVVCQDCGQLWRNPGALDVLVDQDGSAA